MRYADSKVDLTPPLGSKKPKPRTLKKIINHLGYSLNSIKGCYMGVGNIGDYGLGLLRGILGVWTINPKLQTLYYRG